MRYLFLCCVMCVLTVPAVGGAAESVQVNTAFNPPLSVFCRAIAEEAFQRLERPVVLHDGLPAERAIQQVDQGKADADCLRVAGVRNLYRNLIQVPTAMVDVEFVAFTRSGLKLTPGWQGLAAYHVGAVKGWKLIEVNVLAVKPRSFIQVGSADALFRMLALGRIDVAALNRLDGLHKIRELELRGIEPAATPLAAVPLYFTLNKRHAALAQALDETFQTMKQDGTWQAIYQRVFVSDGH